MVKVHAYATPNSVKVPIALEEMGVPYELVPVNLRKGEQKSDAFKAMNANAKVPVLVDQAILGGADIALSESAAILVYLAEATGKLLPKAGVERALVFEQLFFHASGLSPAFLQAFLVKLQASAAPEAAARALAEVNRTLGVLERALERGKFVAGREFSIADIAHFGWIWRHESVGASLEQTPNVARWFSDVSARPAVITAISKTMALAQ
ncbi:MULTISPECIES: glutathione S-transferase family protein [Paraburkholderia]|uniref:Glutathione S-transferase family protein n=1 Tax=Paraburkholderia madseniana TaxID=2599607 RepID=A0AAP5EV87_9BURK|nr:MULTISPECIES: glutathione S-transferase family protein [Paraburkholderia]MCX4146962.1 glutathione S-transferase family protein [Paraburkholderia madseniana]MDN7149905.1 glutathione S-transferase family protein [Paraburkholderia sp. WS6]MDQ6408785.1 glutathione S-transferase family protein [Paraburkholderia madseniana]